jgi:hypothetical protein
MIEVGDAEKRVAKIFTTIFLFEKRTQYLNWDVTIGEN